MIDMIPANISWPVLPTVRRKRSTVSPPGERDDFKEGVILAIEGYKNDLPSGEGIADLTDGFGLSKRHSDRPWRK